MKTKIQIIVTLLGLILPYYFNFLYYGKIQIGAGLMAGAIVGIIASIYFVGLLHVILEGKDD